MYVCMYVCMYVYAIMMYISIMYVCMYEVYDVFCCIHTKYPWVALTYPGLRGGHEQLVDERLHVGRTVLRELEHGEGLGSEGRDLRVRGLTQIDGQTDRQMVKRCMYVCMYVCVYVCIM